MADIGADLPAEVFADFQFEIYARGLVDETPQLPVAVAELPERAREVLSAEAFGYVAGGAGAERTMQSNLREFELWQIVPRMLRDVSARELGTSVLGTALPAPLMLAPVGVQSIVHPEAELATGRAAASRGVPLILSTASSHSIEEVAQAMGRRVAGISSTGPRTVTSPAASWSARERPASPRSSSPWTPGCWAGARATCSMPICPF